MHLFIGALKCNATPPQQPSLERLQGSVDAIGGLLEELLEISRLHARVVEPVVQPQPVSELFAAQQPDAAALAQAQGVAVHWHDGGLCLLADAQLTGRVLRHLVANTTEQSSGGRSPMTAARETGGKGKMGSVMGNRG